MNRSILAALLILPSAVSQAAPFLTTDPTTQEVTHCGIFVDALPKTEIAVTTSGTGKICKYDLANISGGSHTISATFILKSPIWGDEESAKSSVLNFTRPGGVTSPSGLGLTAR